MPKHSTLPGMEQIHATAIDIDGDGVLLRGPSGCGKSDLALRLIDAGARLVADDRTDLTLSDGRVFASAPVELSGRMEVRGVGILTMAALEKTPLALAVDLVGAADMERIPESADVDILGLSVPLLCLAPFEASAVAKIRAALKFMATP